MNGRCECAGRQAQQAASSPAEGSASAIRTFAVTLPERRGSISQKPHACTCMRLLCFCVLCALPSIHKCEHRAIQNCQVSRTRQDRRLLFVLLQAYLEPVGVLRSRPLCCLGCCSLILLLLEAERLLLGSQELQVPAGMHRQARRQHTQGLRRRHAGIVKAQQHPLGWVMSAKAGCAVVTSCKHS